ncbi:MetQ/NlpA family ABC transporter substrate-binding protein [Leptospira ilyithenensis]|uniref:MetQ/NlpA family ABC transporter substrate-binding protein n=1 Tax=Leptospira ilyithenensis TaxID=2484901 RepID=UPI001FE3B478|nr:MetQ/NlpA family ABC transporter substrate-binding protein [Leptospira ilyithenensis]
MIRFISKLRFPVLIGLLVFASMACGKSNSNPLVADRKNLKIEICSGSYGDLLKKAVLPFLSKKGYNIEIVSFSDYIQPNLALASRDIDANLFQHQPYLSGRT